MRASREQTASALISLGYKISRSWHFSARPDDRTPSAYVNTDGSIHDFGDGWHGDLPDFLVRFQSMSVKDSLIEARKLLGRPVEIDFSGYETGTKMKGGYIPERFIRNFEKERREHFARFLYLLDEALPALNRRQQREIAKKYNIGYSHKADRLIMPIRDEEGNCLTLWKYNKNPAPYIDEKSKELKLPSKVKFTRGRSRCPFNLQDLKEYREDKNGWILLCEGEKDCLNALGKGFRAVTLGSASAKIEKKYLHLFHDLKFIVVYDYDEAGAKGLHGYENPRGEHVPGILEQLESVACDVKVWDWELLAFQQDFELFEGYDLTDWLSLNTKEML